MENDNNVTDLSYLNKISNGDIDFIKEMIDVYMKQTPEAINNLEKYLENKDWQMLRAAAHKMKPSFTFFGLTAMDAIINSLEEYSEKEIHLELLPEMIAKIKLVCVKAMTELKQKTFN